MSLCPKLNCKLFHICSKEMCSEFHLRTAPSCQWFLLFIKLQYFILCRCRYEIYDTSTWYLHLVVCELRLRWKECKKLQSVANATSMTSGQITYIFYIYSFLFSSKDFSWLYFFFFGLCVVSEGVAENKNRKRIKGKMVTAETSTERKLYK